MALFWVNYSDQGVAVVEADSRDTALKKCIDLDFPKGQAIIVQLKDEDRWIYEDVIDRLISLEEANDLFEDLND